MVILAMIRLGVWQLGRADEKQIILNQQVAQSSTEVVNFQELLNDGELHNNLRFKQVVVEGEYDPNRSIFLDNQVFDSQVGYLLFTAMRLQGGDQWILVNRGWLPVGESRSELPTYATKQGVQQVRGRLNFFPARPPMLSEDFALPNGSVWPYLPIQELAEKMKISLLPMVVELAPEFDGEADPNLHRRWRAINDQWVATHKGYAFQWFAMAFAFFIACLVLLIRSNRTKPK